MRIFFRSAAAVTASLTLALSLTACSDDAEEAAAHEAEACAATVSLRDSVAQINTLDAQSSVEEVREVRSGIAESYEELVFALDDVADDRVNALNEAYEEFEDSRGDLDGDLTVPQALSEMKSEAQGITEAENGLWAELSCN